MRCLDRLGEAQPEAGAVYAGDTLPEALDPAVRERERERRERREGETPLGSWVILPWALYTRAHDGGQMFT